MVHVKLIVSSSQHFSGVLTGHTWSPAGWYSGLKLTERYNVHTKDFFEVDIFSIFFVIQHELFNWTKWITIFIR